MISVIIPVKNGAAHIQGCLQAVLNQQELDTSLEVIVIDDGSADNSKTLAEDMGVRVLSQDNAGPACARNRGARAACGDILAFTDADCAPDPLWLKHLTQPFENPDIVGSKGAYQAHQRSLVARFVQQEYESKYAHMSREPYTDFIDTYSAAYRREVFLQNGGFDPAFPIPSVEDQEFSFRLARKGYLMVFVPSATVNHQHDQNLWEYFCRKYGIGYWKAFMLHWLPEKAFSDSHTLSSQRWQILLTGMAGIFFLLGFIWSIAWGLLFLALLLFFLTALPFLIQIGRRDVPVIWIAPPMLVVRATAQTLGLAVGFLFPPAKKERPTSGLRLPARLFKRLMDIIGSAIGMIVSLPIVAATAIAIKIEDGGTVFFSQVRVGENGNTFRLYKLRTMIEGAEHKAEQFQRDNPLRGPAFKLPNDPRVTVTGRFLRRWSLDELPQFWNVLVGEMSLVGPRPEEIWVVAMYNDEQRQRLTVKPGLTGPMQVKGRGELDMDERLKLELDYINNYSLWKDIQLLFCTFPAIIKGEGAF